MYGVRSLRTHSAVVTIPGIPTIVVPVEKSTRVMRAAVAARVTLELKVASEKAGMRPPHQSLFFCVIAILAGFSIWGAEDPRIQVKSPWELDPTKGQIEGQAAMAVVPRAEHQALQPAEVTVKLSPMGEAGLELSYSAGSWFVPPPGRKYRVWLETDAAISPFAALIAWNGGPFRSRGAFLQLPLAPAGYVVVPPELDVGANQSLRLLYLGDYLDAGYLRWEITRQVPVFKGGQGVMMPAGPTVAAIWDSIAGQYTSISRPFRVKPKEKVEAPLEILPADRSSLVLLLENHRLSRAEDPLKIVLSGSTESTPDLTVRTAQTIYAFWYDLKPGIARLDVSAGARTLDPVTIQLHPGRIGRVSVDVGRGEVLFRPYTKPILPL